MSKLHKAQQACLREHSFKRNTHQTRTFDWTSLFDTLPAILMQWAGT